MKILRGTFFSLCFLLWTALLVGPYLIIYPLSKRLRRAMVGLWHKGACRITGLKVIRYGIPCTDAKVLLAANHVSYLDIPVIASCLDVTFVAKASVADWPFFGFLAKIAQTAFIERKPSKAHLQKDQLAARLNSGERILIFPEGTSSNGTQVLPFKSVLFEIALHPDLSGPVQIQPVTLSLRRHKNGLSLSEEERDQFAWYGEMSLLPHLWRVFCNPGCEVEILFHPPKPATNFATRKEACRFAEQQIATGLTRLDPKNLSYHESLMRAQNRPGFAPDAWLDRGLHQLAQSILPVIRHPLERRKSSRHSS